VPGARELLEHFEPTLRDLAGRAATEWTSVAVELDRLIDDVRDARRSVAVRLEEGRDRLLEWNSSRPALASTLVGDIGRQDADLTLDHFMLRVFDLYFIEVEELMPRTWRLGSAGVLVDDFPGLKAEGLMLTRDRHRALRREDLQFLTWDHPLATGALDLLLGSEKGNCAFARWIDDNGTTTLYLEALYVLECLAPALLHVDRFLPPTPVRIVVDHRGRDMGDLAVPSGDELSAPRVGQSLLTRADLRDTLLPKMIDRTRALADTRCPDIIQEARRRMGSQHDREIARLQELQRANGTVREEEIALLVEQRSALDDAMVRARPRLDAVRLIHRGPRR
jgi:ATP-dependent helicase HepA